MKKSLKAKIVGVVLGVSLISCQAAVFAAATYSSTVNTAGLFKYGIASTTSSGQVVRARIVIGGSLSDITQTGYVQTDQISGWYTSVAYIAHWAGGYEIANYTK